MTFTGRILFFQMDQRWVNMSLIVYLHSTRFYATTYNPLIETFQMTPDYFLTSHSYTGLKGCLLTNGSPESSSNENWQQDVMLTTPRPPSPSALGTECLPVEGLVLGSTMAQEGRGG